METQYPSMPIAITGRRPHSLLLRPQKGLQNVHTAAEREKIAPAVQSGISSSRVKIGTTAAISIVLPAPIASKDVNNKEKAPRRSRRGAFLSEWSVCVMSSLRLRRGKDQD